MPDRLMMIFPLNELRAVRLGIFSSERHLSFAAIGLGFSWFGLGFFSPLGSLILNEGLSFLESVCVKIILV